MSRTLNYTTKQNVNVCHNNNNKRNMSSPTVTSVVSHRIDLTSIENDDNINDVTAKLNTLLKISDIDDHGSDNAKEKFIKDFYDDEDSESDEDEFGCAELIARGPDRSDRCKPKSQPYDVSRPAFSPYTSSDSSLGSPPSLNLNDGKYSNGGLLTVFPNTVVDEEHGLSVSPNRKQYMHKNGGEFMVNTTTTPSPNVSTSPNLYALSPLSVNAASPNSYATSSHSPTSDYSSSAYESDATTDSFCPLLVTDESSNDADVVSDLIGLIEDRSARDGNKLDLTVYHREIDKILLDLAGKSDLCDQVERCDLSPIPVTVCESETKLKCEAPNCYAVLPNVVSVVRPVLISEMPAYVLSQPTVVPARPAAYPKYRPIKMKCETPANGNILTSQFDAEAIRNTLLQPFTEKDKIAVRCWASKLSDSQLMSGDDDGDRPLHIAIINRAVLPSVCLVNVMANLGARNLDVRNNSGETPLFVAATLKQEKMVEYLLAKGANPNAPCSNNGETVLHHLAQFGSRFLPIVQILCKSALTKIDCFDKLGRTALISAIESDGRLKKMEADVSEVVDSVPVVRCLIQHGASLACQEKCSGKTPFHVAVTNKCLRVLEVLCSTGNGSQEAANCPNYSGQTPLHYASVLNDLSEKEQSKFVKLLLNAGACTKVTNREHKTAADLVDRGRNEVRKLLLSRQRRLK